MAEKVPRTVERPKTILRKSDLNSCMVWFNWLRALTYSRHSHWDWAKVKEKKH
jgi:hypothetical protein